MFSSLALLPADPILGLIAKYRADERPNKIDLGVGVFKDEQGRTPVLACVKAAENQLLAEEESKSYIGPAGNTSFSQRLAELCFGPTHEVLQQQRLAMMQTPGGCGALRIAAELVLRAEPRAARVWVSDPTWANHIPLLGDAGVEIQTYPYYDFARRTIKFDAMVEQLRRARPGDLVLLHGCCHNPSGADLSRAQWQEIAELVQQTGLIPFVDLAYLGFGDGVEEDAYGLRLLADAVPELVVAISCSKNFGLYRERVGAVGVICASAAQAEICQSHLLSIVRGIYSMPPAHGAAVVQRILDDTVLSALWQDELEAMRSRITVLRERVVTAMSARDCATDFTYLARQKGMFSFLGLNDEQVQRLADDYGIYVAMASRVNLAGLNSQNIDYFCDALSAILSTT